MNLANTILVWRWTDAPSEFRALSEHGGDEDWVAFIPISFGSECPRWLESGTPFGCCDVQESEVPNGRVFIGAHS